MKLHLPLPLRTALLSAFVSFIGFSSVRGDVISHRESEYSGGIASGDIVWENGSLICKYNEAKGKGRSGGGAYSGTFTYINPNVLGFYGNKANNGGAFFNILSYSKGLTVTGDGTGVVHFFLQYFTRSTIGRNQSSDNVWWRWCHIWENRYIER